MNGSDIGNYYLSIIGKYKNSYVFCIMANNFHLRYPIGIEVSILKTWILSQPIFSWIHVFYEYDKYYKVLLVPWLYQYYTYLEFKSIKEKQRQLVKNVHKIFFLFNPSVSISFWIFCFVIDIGFWCRRWCLDLCGK